MEKFVLTAELQLVLASSTKKQIDNLKKDLKNIDLQANLKLAKGTLKTLQESINSKQLKLDVTPVLVKNYKTLLQTKLKDLEIKFKVGVDKTSLRSVKTSLTQLRNEFANSFVIDTKIDIEGFEKQLGELFRQRRFAQQTLSNPKATLKIDTFVDIEKFKELMNQIFRERRTAQKTLDNPKAKLLVDVGIDISKFQADVNTINQLYESIQNLKSVKLSTGITKTSVKNLQEYDKSLKTFDSTINSLNLNNLLIIANNVKVISSSMRSLNNALDSLKRKSGRTFDFSFKFNNAKGINEFSKVLTDVYNKLNSANSELSTFISLSRQAGVNFSSIVQASNNINVNNIKTLAGTALTLAKYNNVLSNTAKQTQGVKSQTLQAKDALDELAKQTALTIKRFGAYTIATTGFFKLSFAIRNAVVEFIEYNKELTKVRQVTRQSVASTSELSNQITDLATKYGVSSASILNTSLVIAQAGFNATETAQALEALTKTELAPTFDNIENTVEGAIAAMAQFNIETKDLDKTLSSINAVSAAFAVESSDITTAIQKTGGAFKAAGGSLDELQALFTSVRQTTRESADSIATGFRTIFTRLQRPRTQSFLKSLGIDLSKDEEDVRRFGGSVGEFVGPFEAILRLNAALSQISSQDPRFAQITEELGGFRQISKVIPLIQQASIAQTALQVAQSGTNSLTEDAIVAQQSYANQLTKTKEEFLSLIKAIGEDQEIKNFILLLLDVSRGLIRIAESLKDLAPFLAAIGIGKAISFTTKFVPRVAGFLNKKLPAFSTGGPVKNVGGTGLKDDQIITAASGEYVINAKSSKKLGTNFLNFLNNTGKVPGFASGGQVGGLASKGLFLGSLALSLPSISSSLGFTDQTDDSEKELRNWTETLASGIIQLLAFTSGLKIAQNAIKKAGVFNSTRENIRKNKKYNSIEARSTRDDLELSRANLTSLVSKKERVDQILHEQPKLIKKFDKIQSDIIASNMRISDLRNSKKLRKTPNIQQHLINEEIKKLNQLKKDRIPIYNQLKSNQEEFNFLGPVTKSDINNAQESVRQDRIIAEQNKAKRNRKAALIKFERKYGTSINATGIAASITGNLAGGAIADIGSNSLEKFRQTGLESDLNRNSFVGGSVLSGASSGAGFGGTIGASVGSMFGPLGTLIGGGVGVAIGGVSGGIYSLINASKEFQKQVDLINIDFTSQNLNKILEDTNSGKLSTQFSSSNIQTSLLSLQKNLQSDDADVRQNALASLKNANPQILTFVNTIAASKGSLEELYKTFDESSLRLVAAVNGISFSELTDQISKNIETSRKKIEIDQKAVQAIQVFESNLRLIGKFGSIFKIASDNVDNFASDLESFAFGSGGSTSIQNKIQTLFNGLEVNDNSFSGAISSFTSQFGESGKQIGEIVSKAAEAQTILPDLLLKLRNTQPFEQSEDASVFFEKLLTDAGIDGNIGNLILSNFNELLGTDLKESNLYEILAKDLNGAAKTLSEGLNKPIEEVINSYAIVNENLNEFATNLSKIRDLDKKLLGGRLAVFDKVDQLINQEANFSGKNLNESLFINSRRKENLITSGSSIQNLVSSITSSQDNLRTINSNLQDTQDIQARKELILVMEAQRASIENAREALDYLANNTNKLSVLQDELAKRQNDRKIISGINENFAFGNSASRKDELKLRNAIQNLVLTNGDISSVNPDIRGNVLSRLKELSDIEVFNGQTGQDIINSVLTRQGFATGPSQAEKEINEIIKKELEVQIKAQEALNSLLQNDRNAFFNVLNTNFDTFLTNLKEVIISTQDKEISSQILDLQSRRQNVANNLQNISGLENTFGKDVISNIEDFKNFQERSKKLNEQLFSDRFVSSLTDGAIFNQIGFSGKLSDVSSDATIGLDKATAGINKSNFSQQLKDDILASISLGKIKVDDKGGINPFDLTNLIQELSKASLSKSLVNVGLLDREKERLIKLSDGEDNFKNVLLNLEEIIKRENSLPDGADVKKLSQDLQSLDQTIINLQKRLQNNPQNSPTRFASGGFVSGYGTTDNVPALLTPGEFVLNRKAVKQIGLNNANKLNNVQKFANGGLVKDSGNKDSGNKDYVKKLGLKNIKEFSKGKIPETILSDLFSGGLSVKSADSLIDIDPELRFQQPRGHHDGFSFSNIKGLYRSKSNEVYLKNSSGIDVLTHEIGHAFDYQQKSFSQSKEYLIAYMKDVSKLSEKEKERFKYLLQAGHAGKRESFAAIFDSVVRNNSSSSKYFPESTKLVENLVKDSEIEHLKKDYENIKSLKNVSNPDHQNLVNTISDVQGKISTSLVKNDPRVLKFSEQLDTAKSLYMKKLNKDGFASKYETSDKVSALLTPGENSKKLNGVKKPVNEGLVQPSVNINQESISRLNFTINQLAIQVDNFKNAVASIPTEISLSGRHTVEVIINGATVLQNITPEISKIVEAGVKDGINRMLSNKFPNVGRFDG